MFKKIILERNHFLFYTNSEKKAVFKEGRYEALG
jgi:hypothetical protein